MPDVDLAIIGVGKMGSAIAAGVASADPSIAIGLVGHNQDTITQLVNTYPSLKVATMETTARTHLIAVKPRHVRGVCTELSREPHNLISVAAGVSLDQLIDWSHPDSTVIRAMPNTPVEIRSGVTALTCAPHAEKVLEDAKVIFAHLGSVITVEESQLDLVSAISGSGPAYMYFVIEALEEAGLRLGLPLALARKLSLETMKGAAELAIHSGRDPRDLRLAVTSPGGTTAAAVDQLENQGVRSAFSLALEAATAAAARIRADQG